ARTGVAQGGCGASELHAADSLVRYLPPVLVLDPAEGAGAVGEDRAGALVAALGLDGGQAHDLERLPRLVIVGPPLERERADHADPVARAPAGALGVLAAHGTAERRDVHRLRLPQLVREAREVRLLAHEADPVLLAEPVGLDRAPGLWARERREVEVVPVRVEGEVEPRGVDAEAPDPAERVDRAPPVDRARRGAGAPV